LYTTLHRAFLQTRRRQNRFPQQDLEEVIDQLPDVSTVPSDSVESLPVLPALAKVDETYQAAVTLYYLEDSAYKDIARILEVPVGTVKSRIARGIAQLREILLSDSSHSSTPLDADTPNGALVPVPCWNQAARVDSHLCHSHV
jgi:RNA polymerase sigma-70 factor, ECF subfamily